MSNVIRYEVIRESANGKEIVVARFKEKYEAESEASIQNLCRKNDNERYYVRTWYKKI